MQQSGLCTLHFEMRVSIHVHGFMCRRAIEVAPSAKVAAILEGNLGALLMSAGKLREALQTMDESIAKSASIGSLKTDANVGKRDSHNASKAGFHA